VYLCCLRGSWIAWACSNAPRAHAANEPPTHKVWLDQVIRTFDLTGLDMQSRSKETSLAGLALNVIAC